MHSKYDRIIIIYYRYVGSNSMYIYNIMYTVHYIFI